MLCHLGHVRMLPEQQGVEGHDGKAHSSSSPLPASIRMKPSIGQQNMGPHACRGRKVEARTALLAAVHGYPCNWGAWQALAALASSHNNDNGGRSEADDLSAGLPRHWARELHITQLCLDAGDSTEALGRLKARTVSREHGCLIQEYTSTKP